MRLWVIGLAMLGACATSQPPAGGVTLSVGGIEAPGPDSSFLVRRGLSLGEEERFAGAHAQAYSLLGSEDLIAPDHFDYRDRPCAALPGAPGVVAEIALRAADTQIVIVSERHSRSETRVLTGLVAQALAPLGYDIFAAETFTAEPDILAAQAEEPFARDDDGYYLMEAQFGRMLRQVKAAGFRFVPYEARADQRAGEDAGIAERVTAREEAQTRNLIDNVLAADPAAKILVHVGYSHALETPVTLDDGTELRWFAARLKEQTGIDPLTVSQTHCAGGEGGLVAGPEDAAPGAIDLYVDLPPAVFVRGRPAWRSDRGDVLVDIPEAISPDAVPYIIEARKAGEPLEAVPMDRVFVRPGEDVALLLPPGDYTVRALRVE